MQKFGLVGKKLAHSFSQTFFTEKFQQLNLYNYSYQLFELDSIADIQKLFIKEKVRGLNVTIPYKESVIPFLDALDDEAKNIGAVNCIKISEGKSTGYNTDVYGFAQSIKPFLDNRHERALILGTGGASKAVAYALKKVGVDVYFVTTNVNSGLQNKFLYLQLSEQVLKAFKLIVNCTPLGTYPNIDEAPDLPYQFLTPDHFVYDLVYNPQETKLLQLAKEKGCMTMNGYSMLQLQAEKSWEIWQSAH